MYNIANEIHRFADEESDTIGRDVLRRKLHQFADKAQATCEAIEANYQHKVARQAASMSATARLNVRLRDMIERMVINFTPTDDDYLSEEMCNELIVEARGLLKQECSSPSRASGEVPLLFRGVRDPFRELRRKKMGRTALP